MSSGGARIETTTRDATRCWVESIAEDDLSSLESSIVDSDDSDSDLDIEGITTQALGTTTPRPAATVSDVSTLTQCLQDVLNSTNASAQTVGKINVEHSTNVHIGNVTNINGNIQIFHTDGGGQRMRRHRRRLDRIATKEKQEKSPSDEPTAEEEERVNRDIFIADIKYRIPKGLCSIIPRHTWLAQAPMDEYEYMRQPVKYVIVSHTATESSPKQAINIRIIRDIQCFHIESREWNDIAYNFLIGCDGNAYEGRGWGVVGAHTRGYNGLGIGITFIGCFMRALPTSAALNACKSLLRRGVADGQLAPDYRLIGHCQCRPTESPGRKLYEELQTWEHFYNFGDEDRASGEENDVGE